MRGLTEHRNRWARRATVAALALLCALWTVALIQHTAARAAAGSGSCSPTGVCVVLVEVDGLEPKDVTQETTPYLYSLAHPPAQTPSGSSALANRSGWIWQAPRSVVSTGTASATASLLTGAYPQFSGIPSDEFYDPTAEEIHQRLGAGGFGDQNLPDDADHAPDDGAAGIGSSPVTSLPEAVQDAGGQAAVFLGDRSLAKVAHPGDAAGGHWFPPGDSDSASQADPQFTGDPRLCPIPRSPSSVVPQSSSPGGSPNPSSCPADDMTTMSKAESDLAKASSVNFTFIELAELGMAKRLDGDPDTDPTNPPPSPAHALADTDAAVAAFVEKFAHDDATRWSSTVLMVVGSHGYESTLQPDRVPDPNNPDDPRRDLSDFVNNYAPSGGNAEDFALVPQGTMATVYYKPKIAPAKVPAQAREDALADLVAKLDPKQGGAAINAACQKRDPQRGDCIDNVEYVDPNAPGTTNTVAANHPGWHIDALSPDKGHPRTGASGDLLVTLNPGWAAGRAAGVPDTGQVNADSQPLTNPYTASAGGPRQRAVAALIDGPRGGASVPGAVRNLDTFAPGTKYYPVKKDSSETGHPINPDNPPSVADPACPDTPTDPGGLTCANKAANVPDDANAAGHEAQPELVDFAVTISALLQVPFDVHPDQLQGRVLQEAFPAPLDTPCVGDDCDVQPPPPPEAPPPPLPPPPVEVVQPPEFDFYGLVRRLTAVVVDSSGRTYARARRGAVMSTIRMEGDFGKPEEAVTLTFYRPAGGRRARGSRLRLKAIARFDPFVVKRGHVKIRLAIPPLFKPTHIGVTVREVATGSRARSASVVPCTTVKTTKPVKFKCIGPAQGLVLPIADASRLHSRKGVGRRR